MRINWWRCFALVTIEMMDVAYARATPEMPNGLTETEVDGWWGTMAFEQIYAGVGT